MTVIQKLAIANVGAALLTLLIGGTAQAALKVNSQSAVVDVDTQKVLFTIDFNQVPDFFNVDQFGRQADSFQYYIRPDGKLPVFEGSPYFSKLSTIIRGAEINIAGDIRVRDVSPNDTGEANSGGWGPIRGSVPYTLNSTTLTFSTPLQLIGSEDGLFSYNLLLTEFGGSTDSVNSQSILKSKAVPEPASALSILTFGVLSASLYRRKQKLALSALS